MGLGLGLASATGATDRRPIRAIEPTRLGRARARARARAMARARAWARAWAWAWARARATRQSEVADAKVEEAAAPVEEEHVLWLEVPA